LEKLHRSIKSKPVTTQYFLSAVETEIEVFVGMVPFKDYLGQQLPIMEEGGVIPVPMIK
jgi:hypothetical protein